MDRNVFSLLIRTYHTIFLCTCSPVWRIWWHYCMAYVQRKF